MKSLKGSNHQLSDSFIQLQVLNGQESKSSTLFAEKLSAVTLYPLKPRSVQVMQVNLGKMCNQTCRHCHVDAGPDRKEIMSLNTMQQCLDALQSSNIQTVDLTGGAPEMNPHFRWFVERLREMNIHVIVRCNLTIIVANKKFHDLPEFYKKHQVEIVSSLPYYSSSKTDSQRGDGVFSDSIKALKMLNQVGYGIQDSGLILNLVYNPSGAFLPPSEASLESDYKRQLSQRYSISFNKLYAITNLPISRFLDYLITSGNYTSYMDKLLQAFNPAAAENVMCRSMISVGYDGYLYDCDFNQMLDLRVDTASHDHISRFSTGILSTRNIVVNQHCFGCTAGAGSSCGGELVS